MDLAAAKEWIRTKQARRVAIVVVATGLVIFSAAWNPPITDQHDFTQVSDYDPEKESGCVNSGGGCHGDESEYRDFNAYHPNAECTTCHEFQGVGCIPCHVPNKNHECATCHDGSMEGAADVVRLTDPFPRGHYRETTHTALGTDMEQEVRSAEDGTAKARCKDCHARDLRNSHTAVPVVAGSEYGPDIGCGECHNDVRSFGMAEVTSDWEKRQCESCHKTGGSSPMHDAKVAGSVEASGTDGCGESGEGCHAPNDLHALHPDEPATCSGSAADGEGYCHDLELQSHEPTATSCGTDAECHGAYTKTTGHENMELHSPETNRPASDVSYYGVACGACHWMQPDGTSLLVEHSLPTSQRTSATPGDCGNCHNHPASLGTIADDWSERDSSAACSTCHGIEDLGPVHDGDVSGLHTVDTGSEGCASTGAGCHPTADLSQVGEPGPLGNIHASCLRCHDRTATGGNLAYDPEAVTCGETRDCHGAVGQYDPDTAVHDGPAGLADGTDADHHTAGAGQADALWLDETGVRVACSTCHSMVLGVEHARSGASMATGSGTPCTRCHGAGITTANAVKASWQGKDSSSACAECHGKVGVPAIHADRAGVHAGVELSPVGLPLEGSCETAGCHTTTDLRNLHRASGCTMAGCHRATDSPVASVVRSCGGIDARTSCHVGYSAANHFVSHASDIEGTVDGISYALAANVGCFGCHVPDLAVDHANSLTAGQMDGAASGGCAVCHDVDGVGGGDYASLQAVSAAVAAGDRRCSSCHASESAEDGPDAVASAHRRISTETTLAPGYVWSDPFDDWREALDSVTGGGHNALTAAIVGASADKSFPTVSYEESPTVYTWSLMPNVGATTWLDPERYPSASVDTAAEIQAMTVRCDDCHMLPDGMAGPHGAAVRIYIDPEYSQTAYSDPPMLASQFEADGTDRVVCFKCHPMRSASSAEETLTPGGHYLHARHVKHTERYEPGDPTYYGEKCIDCHVRIPHAWKRPRLLVRTVETTDRVAPDEFPYVRRDHDGLAGVVLQSYTTPTSLRAASCANGGCYDGHTVGWHPWPQDVPSARYWP